jgi:peptide/nickel transport system substrate-binding protein
MLGLALTLLSGVAFAGGSSEQSEPAGAEDAGEGAGNEAGADAEEAEAGQTGAGQTGAQQARILEFALSGNPDTLDPHKTTGTLTFQVLRSVYDTLVEPNRNGEIVPALAKAWEVSDDRTRWTFRLREGVRFHNGDRFTAADVKATLDRIMADETGSPNAAEYSAISEVRIPDEHTVVLELSEPYAPLLATLASGWSAIMPEELIDSGHDFASKPVGTGPFTFEEWVRDTRIELSRNERYWMKGHPKVGGVNINIITENAVRVQGLITGDLDIVDTVNDTDLPRLRSNPNTKVERYLSGLVLVLAMNTDREPLSELPVRQAIAHAIDKQAALDAAYGGGKVVHTFMDYSDPYYSESEPTYPHDPDQARELLREAGYGDGPELQMAVPQNYEAHVAGAEVYQEMLSEVGIDVQLRQVDWSTWLSDVYRGGNFDLTVIGHTGKLDPDGRLRTFITDDNYVGFSTERLSGVLERARRVVDVEKRKELYAEALGIFAEKVPHVYIGSPYIYVGMREEVSGFHVDPKLETFDFRYVELE